MPDTALVPVAATATRNFCVADPLLDWLQLYGEGRGFVPDNKREGYDPETDMGLFMRDKGRAFEAGVMAFIRDAFEVVTVSERGIDAQDPAMIAKTLEAIQAGVVVIYQGVLFDEERQTYGIPDLLVRVDVVPRLCELAASQPPFVASDSDTSPQSGAAPGTDIPGLVGPEGSYVVVDIKFTGLDLNSKGWVGNDASDRRRKAQLLVYNRALAAAQGYEPPAAYLIGRSWKQIVKSVTYRGDSCFGRLAPCDMRDPELDRLVDSAVEWVQLVRTEGASWEMIAPGGGDGVVPRIRPELYPNMSNTQDSPWHMTKREIAEQLKDVTLLWNVTPKHRPTAHEAGVFGYTDPTCHANVFGVSENAALKLQQIIDINRPDCEDLVRPAVISAGQEVWRTPGPLEFYVDFETVSDLDDDFSNLPRKGGQTLIFMIGCGHVEDGEWVFKVFTCDQLLEEDEARIIEEWHAHMAAVKARLWPNGNPLAFHWSHAETSTMNSAYNSAQKRHNAVWPDLNWYDFLMKVVREEPVVTRGSLAFGLKSVAKAMQRQGLIQTVWDNGPGDGLGAMVGAWRCDAAAKGGGCSMKELPLMKSIEEYNEVDCRVMMEIIGYLRANH